MAADVFCECKNAYCGSTENRPQMIDECMAAFDQSEKDHASCQDYCLLDLVSCMATLENCDYAETCIDWFQSCSKC